MFHLFTTTTQLHFYNSSAGSRQDGLFFKIFAGQYGFPSDCILDIDIGLESITDSSLIGQEIEFIGCLSHVDMKHIFELIPLFLFPYYFQNNKEVVRIPQKV